MFLHRLDLHLGQGIGRGIIHIVNIVSNSV
jgi:hypothetical protein